jgi:signal transduction histidine kinase
MIRRKINRFRLGVLFSLIVMLIFMITGFLMAMIGAVVIHFGLLGKFGLRMTFPVLLAAMVSSVIVGTAVSMFVGRIPLRPIREVIDATNRLAAGDFSVRIRGSHVPEFVELRDSFNRMATELSSIEVLRGDFINNFSHEFKTPIVSIKGFAELLKMDDLPREERNEYLDIIIRESSRLSAMATNVLSLSKVENQTIVADKQTYELGEQIRRCILMLQNNWEHRDIRFELELNDIMVNANEEMMSQVWLNLIDNAVKFSRDQGRVVVTLNEIAGNAVATVRDYGAGIAEKDLPHIFDKYYQSDVSRAIPGNGLGLTLAKRIVELHGGSIACASKENRWTEFTVRLPMPDSAAVSAKAVAGTRLSEDA